MWNLDHKEDWAPKNWCFWTVVLEKTLQSPLDNKEIKPANSKGNQPLLFTGRTDGRCWRFNTSATQCKQPSHWKRPWFWERLRAGGEENNRGWDACMASLTQWTSLSKLWEMVKGREAWHAAVYGITKSWTACDWTTRDDQIAGKAFLDMHLSMLLEEIPCGSDGKASAYNAGDLSSIPELGRSPGEGNGNPLQYSCLENAMDGGAW